MNDNENDPIGDICEVCKEDKLDVRKRKYKLGTQVLKSQSEMCDDCAKGIGNVFELINEEKQDAV